MPKQTILHLSDLHMSFNSPSRMKELYNALIDDVKNNIEGSISFVVCTGDLTQTGSNKDMETVFGDFLIPIVKELNICETQLIYVPGNHEVDISQIDSDFANSFTSRILKEGVTSDDISKPNVKNRLLTFFKNITLLYPWDQNELVFTHKTTIENISYGISLINTAWNTAGG